MIEGYVVKANAMRTVLCLLLLTASAGAADEFTWWIEPCTPAAAKSTGCEAGDEELGRWALEAWQRETSNAIVFKKSIGEEHARVRIHWASGQGSLYGETQRTVIDGKPGADIYVLPDIRALGADIAATGRTDPLFRTAIVYLTCLHESGHALGLQHTRNFADIMYSFGYGGDVVEYFQRYRRLLKTRENIPAHSGVSESDHSAITRLANRPSR